MTNKIEIRNKKKDDGFIKAIIILIIAFIMLGFFVDIKSLVNKNYAGNMGNNYQYVRSLATSTSSPITISARYMWNDIGVKIIYKRFISTSEERVDE